MSQSILRDTSFLSSDLTPNYDLRLKVLHATKIIVGKEFFINNEDEEGASFANFAVRILDAKNKTKLEDSVTQRQKLWDKYSIPPFDCQLIENEDNAFLIEKRPDGMFNVRCMYRWKKRGVVMPISVMGRDEAGCVGMSEVQLTKDEVARGIKAMRRQGQFTDEEITEKEFRASLESVRTAQILSMMEVLLFLNMKNIRLHHYLPSKKEMEKVPKPLQEFYTYRILDVYRERDCYVSLADALEHLGEAKKLERKAHLVRGHFKDTRHGLFWWSAFVRNAKNAATLGVVDKDYHLMSDPQKVL